MIPIKLKKIPLYATIAGFLAILGWFCSGLPATFALRKLGESPEVMVFTEDSSENYRKWTQFVENAPFRDGMRNFLLQYIEAQTSRISVRFLHPLISADQVKLLEGLAVVYHLDVKAGAEADQVAEHLAHLAPNLRILQLEGHLTEQGLRFICQGLPRLESLYLSDAELHHAMPELVTRLPRLREVTFSESHLGRDFIESLNGRPDVKALIK